jgi:hypothetical protein
MKHFYALSVLAVVSAALAPAANFVRTAPIEQEQEHLKAAKFEVATRPSTHLTNQGPREEL